MARRGGMINEFLALLGETKKWWMLPIICVMVLLIAVVVISATTAGPFIYTLF